MSMSSPAKDRSASGSRIPAGRGVSLLHASWRAFSSPGFSFLSACSLQEWTSPPQQRPLVNRWPRLFFFPGGRQTLLWPKEETAR